jgi:flagellar motor switch protein FliM
MMEMLDQERISEIVEAAKDGHLPEPSTSAPRRRRNVRTVDFSRPTKFSADHQRRLGQATETFCQMAATRLTSELRCPVELDLLGTSQLTWSASQSRIAPRSMLSVLELEPLGTRVLLTLEQSLIVMGLECLLGGTPDQPPRDRRLSEIDWSLAKGLVESIVAPLSNAWQDLAGTQLRLVELATHEAGQMAPVSEPTYSTQIEIRVNKQSFAIGLLLPWSSVEPLDLAISGRDPDRPAGAVEVATAMQAPMSAVPVAVRAEVAHMQMAIADILKLGPGSVIEFEAKAEDGVELYADSVRLARGRPGRQGPRRAVQLTDLVEETR